MKSILLRIGYLMVPFTFLISGCGGNKQVKQNQVMAEISKPVIMEKTGTTQRPQWTTQTTTFYEDEQGFHFTGGVMGGSDYALTLRLAKSEALKNLLESIEIKARSEFTSVMHGNFTNDAVGRYVNDAIAWTVENIRVHGIRQRDIYYEQSFDPVNHRIRYNTWVRLVLSRADYIRAKTEAAERLLKKAIRDKDEEAKQKARELLDRLQSEV